MKSLQESLFDKDLVQQEIRRIPGTIGWKWDFDHCIAMQRIDNNKVYQIFDKNYIKKWGPNKNELNELFNSYTYSPYADLNNNELRCFKMQANMGFVILTWKDDILPEPKDRLYVEHGSKLTPGIIFNNSGDVLAEIGYTRADKLEVTVYNGQAFVSFYFIPRKN